MWKGEDIILKMEKHFEARIRYIIAYNCHVTMVCGTKPADPSYNDYFYIRSLRSPCRLN